MGELEKFVPSRATIFLEAKNKAVVYVITGVLGQTLPIVRLPASLCRCPGQFLRTIRATFHAVSPWLRETVDGQKSRKQNSEVEGLRLDVELRRRGLVTLRNALGNEGKIIGMLDQNTALGVQLVGVPIGINRNTFQPFSES
jgi:hypothetical protein